MGYWLSNTKQKLAENNFYRRKTGMKNFSEGDGSLSPLEEKLLAIKGKSSVDGVGKTKEIGLSGHFIDSDVSN